MKKHLGGSSGKCNQNCGGDNSKGTCANAKKMGKKTTPTAMGGQRCNCHKQTQSTIATEEEPITEEQKKIQNMTTEALMEYLSSANQQVSGKQNKKRKNKKNKK